MKKANHHDKSFAVNLIEVIHHSKIFSEIDRRACESLLPRLEKVILHQGQILFEQGDPSDCLYIVVEGQLTAMLLTAEGKFKVVGTVDKGETVGELGALSNQPRSLTIRAGVECKLLKLPRKEFEEFCKEQPKFIARIIDLIIFRSQNTLKLISQRKLYKHIAIIRGNQDAPITQFMERLTANFPHDAKIILFNDVTHETPLSSILDQAEHENQTVIFTLDENNFDGLRSKLNHIGGIFVVMDGDIPTPMSDFAAKLLTRHETPFTTQYELVLMHDDTVLAPSGTMEWLSQASFTLHHHMHISDDLDYQRIIRFMTGRAVGLVLGGGGHKGWACVGAIKALMDAHIPIDAIGGTSVGAAVGACYILSRNYQDLFAKFNILSGSVSAPFGMTNITWPLISILSAKRPTESLKQVFKDIQIEDMWLPFFSVACNLSTGKEVSHHHGMLWEKVRASVSIPGLAPPLVMEGELYVDGGLLNNLPVDYMRAQLGEESIVIAVSLVNKEEAIKHYSFPPVLPFWTTVMRKLGLGYHDYSFPPFFNTFLNALLVGSSTKERTNQLLADVLISPDLSQYRTLKIKLKVIQNLIDTGYHAADEEIKASKLFP